MTHYIEILNNTIKKTFNYTGEDNQTFLRNEVFWLNYLKSKWVPELLEVGNNYVITKYYGPDLNTSKVMPDKQQVIEMYKFFKEKNVFKINGSLSNMTMNGNQLVAFDWKWARFSTDRYAEFEFYSYDKWISKIDNELVKELKKIWEEN
tara:strand:+ start:75 stop:521 length:447 start_codon:yes stop_codon:yes gene_type:complete